MRKSGFSLNEDQKYNEDEIKDILEYGISASWAKKMMEQGFDPIAHTLKDFIEICECLKFTKYVLEVVNNLNGKASKQIYWDELQKWHKW